MNGDCPAAERVRRWVERLVIGEGLCPFAARPWAAGQVRVVCSAAGDADGAYRDLLAEVDYLLRADPGAVETSLLVVPGALSDFDEYLDVLAAGEEALQTLGLEAVLQLASFHPDYRFEGEADDDPGHYTNRAPSPVFHLIRQASISGVLRDWPNPEDIPRRNRRRMRTLGLEYLRRLSASAPGPD